MIITEDGGNRPAGAWNFHTWPLQNLLEPVWTKPQPEPCLEAENKCSLLPKVGKITLPNDASNQKSVG
jgi:hypothetical protein